MKKVFIFERLLIGARFEFNAALYVKNSDNSAFCLRTNETYLFFKKARTITEVNAT